MLVSDRLASFSFWPLVQPFSELLQRVADRRYFIGGSDARIIMGSDEAALLRLWRAKRGEGEPEDLSANLVVQLGLATEDLNRRWYQANTAQVLTDVQRQGHSANLYPRYGFSSIRVFGGH